MSGARDKAHNNDRNPSGNPEPETPDIDILLSQELTVRRQILHGLFQENKVDFSVFVIMTKGFEDEETLYEIEKAKAAIQFGFSPERPNIDLPSTQFVWAVALSFILNNYEDTLPHWPELSGVPREELSPDVLIKTMLWKQLTGSMRAKKELLMNVNIANSATRRNDTKIKWGVPGKGTHFLYKNKTLIVDMVEALTEGFIHYRSKIATEVSRGILSKDFPLKMPELSREIKELKEKQAKQNNNLSPEDYKKLRLKHFEWSLKNMFYRALEGNALFDHARGLKDFFYQDMAKSLNHYAVTLMQVSEIDEGSQEKQTGKEFFTQLFDNVGEEFVHLCRVMELAFYKENNLLEAGLEGWKSVGLNPEKIRNKENRNNTRYSTRDFEILISFIQDKETGLQHLKPEVEEILHGPEFFESQAKGYNKGRNILIEQIWNSYADHLMRDMLTAFEKILDEEMKQKAEMEKLMEEMRKKNDEEILSILEQAQQSVGKASNQLDIEMKKGKPQP